MSQLVDRKLFEGVQYALLFTKGLCNKIKYLIKWKIVKLFFFFHFMHLINWNVGKWQKFPEIIWGINMQSELMNWMFQKKSIYLSIYEVVPIAPLLQCWTFGLLPSGKMWISLSHSFGLNSTTAVLSGWLWH